MTTVGGRLDNGRLRKAEHRESLVGKSKSKLGEIKCKCLR